MGFLKKERAPNELPDLALDNSENSNKRPPIAPNMAPAETRKVVASIGPAPVKPEPISEEPSSIPDLPQKTEPKPVPTHTPEPKKEVAGEDYLEFSPKDHNKIDTKEIESELSKHIEKKDAIHPKFFDKVLDDINGEIQDLGKLEDWYRNKFSSQDIVSNMKGYWEGNKAEIIIQSFGAEYKKKINTSVKELQKLEEEWRIIYFDLIKKEEEMKEIEQELKGTLSEFVDLCKRRKNSDEKREK